MAKLETSLLEAACNPARGDDATAKTDGGEQMLAPQRGAVPSRRIAPPGQARSKRSAFITLTQALTKSCTKTSAASSQA